MEYTGWWRRPRLLAAAACLATGLAVIALGPLYRNLPTSTSASAESLDDPFAAEVLAVPTAIPVAPTTSPPPPDVIVYISGAVAKPDVYRLPADARVKDAVLAAGGLLAEAAGETVNLAAPLSDAAHIHIPHVGELAPAPVAELPGVTTANPLLTAEAAPAPESGTRLDLNRATHADLEELPGIGKVLAERIIAYRTEHGAFGSVADLRSVSGIGAKLFAQLEPLVMVNGQH
jgi:competence protein ComEA